MHIVHVVSRPRIIWFLLCLLAGGPCAFLALEGVGIPIVALLLATLIGVGRRRGFLAEALIAFGLPYAAVVLHFAIPDAADASDVPGRAYFIVHIAVAIAILAVGIGLLVRRRREGDVTPDDRKVRPEA